MRCHSHDHTRPSYPSGPFAHGKNRQAGKRGASAPRATGGGRPRQTPNHRWWLALDGEVTGPFSRSELAALAHAGRLQPGDPVCREHGQEWAPAAEIAGLYQPVFDAGQAPDPPYTQAAADPFDSFDDQEDADAEDAPGADAKGVNKEEDEDGTVSFAVIGLVLAFVVPVLGLILSSLALLSADGPRKCARVIAVVGMIVSGVKLA